MLERKFDDSNIPWRALEGFDDVAFFVYKVDEDDRIVDVLYKFAPDKRQPLHRHKCPYATLVLQGEQRFYRPNGELKEIRPTGSCVTGLANGEPHLEGAGDREAIVFFTHHNIEDALYDFLDENGEQIQLLGIAEFKAQFDAQIADGTARRVAGRPA